MGLEVLLGRLVGENDAMLMLGAFILLIACNFFAEMSVEVQKKDLKWNDLGRFIKLILLNALFLFGLELVMIPAARVPYAYDFFVTVQTAGWLAVMAYYFFGFYQNLKALGLKSNQRFEQAIEVIKQEKREDR